MSRNIEENVVKMEFDNSNFESNVRTSTSSLDKLKSALRFDGVSKGFDTLNGLAGRTDFSVMKGAVGTVTAKFSALQVAGITALTNITNQAVNAGKRIASALTIKPIKSGFEEYETQMNAIQTILSNTESKGTTLKDVKASLAELNTYADKTIYNFAQMTKNIGTFTAAGIELKPATKAIQGIANLAAVSGSNAQQASTAMYQLSQALSTGALKLQDWNSVTNAGMGGQIFQEALKDTARHYNKNVDAIIKKAGSFRESLSKGWITSEILSETLQKMTKTGAAEYLSKLTGISEKQIKAQQKLVDENKSGKESYEELAKAMGKTGKIKSDEALKILKLADNAENAATKVKTITQLWDTLQESVQSGWTTTWQYIIGDFEEAKNLLTDVNNRFSKIIDASSDSRNKIMKDWVKNGGRDSLIKGFNELIDGIQNVSGSIKKAFNNVFEPLTGKKLASATKGIEGLIAKFKEFTGNKVNATNITKTFQGIFSAFNIGKKTVKAVLDPILNFFTDGKVGTMAEKILEVTGKIGESITNLDNDKSFEAKLMVISDTLEALLKNIGESVKKFKDNINDTDKSINQISTTISKIANFANNALSKIIAPFKKAIEFLKEHISFTDIFSGAAFIAVYKFLKQFDGIMDKIKDLGENFKKSLENFDKDKFKDVMESIKGTLSAFTSALNVSSLLVVSVAIALLVDSIRKFSELDISGIVKGLAGIGGIAVVLSTTVVQLLKKLHQMINTRGVLKLSVSMAVIALAIKTLADALVELSNVRIYPIIRGLIGLGGAALILSTVVKKMAKLDVKGFGIRQAATFVILAKALKVVADAVLTVKDVKIDQMAIAVGGLGASLLIMVGALKLLDMGKYEMRIKKTTMLMFLVLAESMSIAADAINKIAKLKIDQVGVALAGIGGALTEMTLIVLALDFFGRLIDKKGGKSGLLAASVSMRLLSETLVPIAEFFDIVGRLEINQVGVALAGLGGALAEMGIVVTAVGKLGKGWSLLGSISTDIVIAGLKTLAEGLEKLSELDWPEIGRSITALGAAMVIMNGVPALAAGLTKGLSALGAVGTAAMMYKIKDLAEAFGEFAKYDWPAIGRGITAMFGCFAALAVGSLGGFGGNGLSNKIEKIAVPLNKLADAFGKFGKMKWDEIGRASTAMLSTMSQITLALAANSLTRKGADTLATIAEPMGKLVDSVKKWKDVKVPENLMDSLNTIANAVFSFTLDNWASSNINKIGESLGQLADSVKKWKDVKVPTNLADNLAAVDTAVSKMWGTIGEKSLKDAAVPLGDMADSIKKWSNLKVPEDLCTNLEKLSNSISSYFATWISTKEMKSAASSLKDMAGAVAVWQQNKINISEKQINGIKGLAEAVKAFSFDLLGGLTISLVAPAISMLASSVAAWKDIKIPDTLGGELEKFSAAFKNFNLSVGDSITILATNGGLKNIADALNTISNLKIPNDLSGQLDAAGGAIHTFMSKMNGAEFSKLQDFNNMASAVNLVNTAMQSIKVPDSGTIDGFINSIKKIAEFKLDTSNLKSSAENITAYVNNMLATFSSVLSSGKSNIDSGMETALSGIPTVITNKSKSCVTAITKLLGDFESKIKNYKGKVNRAFKTMMGGAEAQIKNFRGSMVGAGQYLGDGLVTGIQSKYESVYWAAYNLGRMAVQGELDGQQSHSPSRAMKKAGKWFGQGLIIGIDGMSKDVYNASYKLGDGAVDSVSDAIGRISDVVDGDMKLNPTITPVMDLSDVTSGTKDIDKMLSGTTYSINGRASGIDQVLSKRRQNGTNAEVVSAINKLRGDIGNINNTSYNIGGVTYNQGDDVAQAIETIVRATVINRRS